MKKFLYIVGVILIFVGIVFVLSTSKAVFIGENNNWKVRLESELSYLNVERTVKVIPKNPQMDLPKNLNYVIFDPKGEESHGSLFKDRSFTYRQSCSGCKHYKFNELDFLLIYYGHPTEKIILKKQ